jgi:hypothetical protein
MTGFKNLRTSRLTCNRLIVDAMLKRRKLANSAIVNICNIKHAKIRLVK